MKVLQICHRIPFPPVDGGNIAMMNMALSLSEAGIEVHQFALNTKKHFIDPKSLPQELVKKLHMRSIGIDTKISGKGVMKNLFTSESYNIIRFYNKDVEKELENIFRENNFDIVQLETLFTAPYIPCIRKHSLAKIVLRAHNVEHIIWERLAVSEKNIVKKKYLRFLAKRLKKFETETLNQIDALVPITCVDESVFKVFNFHKPVMTIPVGVDIKEYSKKTDQTSEMCLFHLGSMDWLPNLEAVSWFLKSCWPQVHKMYPALKLYLAGRNFPDAIINARFPNVICEGRIEDSYSYISGKQIMVVPLHSGSGMRVKIIQGLALGRTIISTTIGAEGIPVEHEKNILIANSVDDFISTINKCIQNPEWCIRIGENGRKFVEEKYSNHVLGNQLKVFYNALSHLE